MEQWGSNYVKLVNFNNLETLIYHLFGVTGIESSMEKSARWINLLQETTQSAWWHIQNGQNTFLGRFFVLWESFQGGVWDLHDIFLKFVKLVPAMYFSMEFISKTIQLIRYECTLCIKVPKLTLKAIQKLNNCLLKLYM